MIEIDGSFGESGGAILRVASVLSAIKKIPCYVFNIRKGRPKPGLMPQHLLGIQALSQLCNGRLEGDFLGSEEVKFYPGQGYQDQVSIKIGTAGSITLVLQTLVPPALFAPFPVRIIFDGGATDTFFSPTIDYFRFVFLKILEKMGGKVEVEILKRGYYPTGGSEVKITIFPSDLRPINLTERGELQKILIISGASEFLKTPKGVRLGGPYGAGKKVAERQIAGTREILGKLKLPIEQRVEYYQTTCPGSQICLIAEFENTIMGTDNLGKLGKRAEDVGKEAVLELLKEQKSGACLDKHLTDQILVYLALSKGKSKVTVSEITEHCKTNIWVIEKFTQHRNKTSGAGFLDGKFEIKDKLIFWLPEKTQA